MQQCIAQPCHYNKWGKKVTERRTVPKFVTANTEITVDDGDGYHIMNRNFSQNCAEKKKFFVFVTTNEKFIFEL